MNLNLLSPLGSLVGLSKRFLRYESETDIGKYFSNWLPTKAGININPDTAMRFSTFYACLRVLAEDTAALPAILYRSTDDDFKERATDHPLYSLLHDLPNERMTSFELLTMMMLHKMLRGWGYARIIRNGRGQVAELRFMNTDRTRVLPARRTDELPAFEYYDETNDKILLNWDDVWKISGPFGCSLLSAARESIGLGLAQENYAASFFSNYAAPRGVVQFKGTVGEDADQLERWRKNFVSTYAGNGTDPWGVAVLDNGAEFKPISINNTDAQFLEGRKFQRSEICGICRVPPHRIADLDRATNNNIEQQSLDYLTGSLIPHLIAFQQSAYRDLFTFRERKELNLEFLTAGLLRGDLQSRFNAYAQGRVNGWLSANDIRRMENMNPVPDGDIYLVPMNSIPANMAGKSLVTPSAKT